MDISRSEIQVKQALKYYTILLANNENLYKSNLKEQHWSNAHYKLFLYKYCSDNTAMLKLTFKLL